LKKILERKVRRVEAALTSNEKIASAIGETAQDMLKSKSTLHIK
jgi:hypothetical protein